MNPADAIPSLRGRSAIEPVAGGFSGDRKYRVRRDGDDLLLRLFDPMLYEKKEREFAILGEMSRHGVRCQRPLEMGRMPDGTGYLLLSFLVGEDGEKALPRLNPETQFQIGNEAGRELRAMHEHSAPASVAAWSSRQGAKYRRYLNRYRTSSVRFSRDDEVIAFIERELPLMADRPNRFQHDDFHVRNLIVEEARFAGVIDFDRFDWGDPIHDFLKVGLFSAEVSHAFCRGQIEGYLGGSPDERFWRLYALYLAMSLVSSVVWTLAVVPETTTAMMARIEEVLADHSHFQQIIPRWYGPG